MGFSIKQLWLEFRLGHSGYLGFGLQMANFVIIAYALLISRFFNNNGGTVSWWEFIILFTVCYVPLAVVFGRWHIKRQYEVENRALFEQNSTQARVFFFLIKMIEGTATEEEKKEMKEYLTRIGKM